MKRSTLSLLSAFFALTLVLTFGFEVRANSTCESLFKTSSSGVSISGSSEKSPAAVAEELQALAAFGVSNRGFISARFPLSSGLSSEAAKRGLIWWYLRIFIAPSPAAARVHAEREADNLMQGIYLIDPMMKPGTSSVTPLTDSPLTKAPAPQVYESLVKSGDVIGFKWVSQKSVDAVTPRVLVQEQVDKEYLSRNLKPEEMTWDMNDPESGPYINQRGWTFPKERGVILHSDTVDSSTYERMRKLAAKLIDQGFSVRFNADFKRALEMVRDQPRRVGGQWVKNSRYLDQDIFDSTVENFRLGRAYSIEVWNEKGELVGGLIGNREGSIYSPDSVFYNNEQYPKISIDFAKIAMVAQIDRLHSAGIPFADAGMVSHYTASMKGTLIEGNQFMELVKSLPPESKAVVDLTTPWHPRELAR